MDYYSQHIGLWHRACQSNTWAKTWNEQLMTQTSRNLIALSLAKMKFLGNLVPGEQWLAVMLCFLQFFYFPQLTCLLYVLYQCHSQNYNAYYILRPTQTVGLWEWNIFYYLRNTMPLLGQTWTYVSNLQSGHFWHFEWKIFFLCQTIVHMAEYVLSSIITH